MSYYEKYHCIDCPVEEYCGAAVASTRLCHSLDDTSCNDTSHILTLSETDKQI